MTLLLDTPTRSRAARLRAPVVSGAGLAVATLTLRFRDPHGTGSWGLCPWLVLTGQYCPGCGGLRAVNDLTHGDLAAAASSNLLFVALLPLIALVAARWVIDAWTGRQRAALSPSARTTLIGAFVVLALVFTVVRNTPVGSWLAP